MKEIWRSPVETEGFARFALHPNGKWLLTVGMDGKTLNLWDLENSKLLWSQSYSEYSAGSPAFSPDGKIIFDASARREDLWFFNTENGHVRWRVEIPDTRGVGADFHACFFGTQPETVIINCCGSTACLSAVDASVLWIDIPSDEACCECMRMTPQGNVVYLSPSSSVLVRDAATGDLIKEFPLPEGIAEFSLSSNGQLIAYVTPSNVINIVSIETEKLVRKFHTKFEWYSRPVWSQDDSLLAGEMDQGNGQFIIAVIESMNGTIMDEYPISSNQESSQLEFHPSKRNQLICGFDTGECVLLEFDA